ncbi:MAG TPA: CoA transferase, partial [Solirubrobacteraceae bacterium]|nr:CoA transferase [Solirubrobacteraceae bacterium]
SEAHAEVERVFAARSREEWARFGAEHDCCLEPVLELDEALDSELVRARKMVAEIAQPGASRPVRLLSVPVKLSATPGDPAQRPGPALGEHTHEVLTQVGFSEAQVAELQRAGAVAGLAGPGSADPARGPPPV